ncbi:MAG TPA: cob(I)yrinic acid a,c-diamide adenosyltransferase [Methanomassiliicoccales archaeon]|nr:cob(I)yrinic acid a,c-diamide adenosyltransferase [Methanomassiliicoccales archaeon]
MDGPMAKEGLGLVHVYTGDGKGKTTAALGLAMRASGNGLKVLMIQFMKTPDAYAEQWAHKSLPGLEIRPMGLDCLIDKEEPRPEDIEKAQEGLRQAMEAMASGEWDMVILDEVNVAVRWGLVKEGQVLDAVRGRAKGVEVVLTGRYAPAAFIEEADLVTEMRNLKHYYDRGVLARDGIER